MVIVCHVRAEVVARLIVMSKVKKQRVIRILINKMRASFF
jgi:hypothetical protein